jgi:sodium-dependent dicarboxylate transporter 2/3/5
MSIVRYLKLFSGPILGVLVYLMLIAGGSEPIMAKMAGVGVFVAAWWITEAVNIYYTALLPVVLLPFLGVLPMAEVAPLYMKEIIFLFIGGFLIAFGLQKWNLHKRIALKIILMVGNTPTRVLLGFMLASYLLSMWILNTATVTMLLPAVLAVIQQVEQLKNGEKTKLATPLLLGLAYASSIGGVATLIGTAPNMVLHDFYNESYPIADQLADPQRFGDPAQLSFANWFAFGFPISIVLFIACFLVLRVLYRKSFRQESIDVNYCKVEYAKLGKMSYEEKALGYYFLATVLLWFFRKDLTIGSFQIPGWEHLFGPNNYIKESTIAMLTACLLFLHPSKQKKGENLIGWNEMKGLPIGILFLFGGGFALAKGFEVSGLSEWIGGKLGVMSDWDVLAIIFGLCLAMTFLTELTSNTASTILVMPLIFSLASNVDVHPLLLFVPVTLSASCAFMLPVATPPNTIVFGSERITVSEMSRVGIWLNLIGVLVISFLAYFLIRFLFPV